MESSGGRGWARERRHPGRGGRVWEGAGVLGEPGCGVEGRGIVWADWTSSYSP